MALRVANLHRVPRFPMICLETALPVKFDTAIVEAIGEHAPRPAQFEGLEGRPQRFERLPADAAQLKSFIADRII
jgi:threonine synthase